MAHRLGREDYTVGWVCALPIELAAAQEMLDNEHAGLPQDSDDANTYTLGCIDKHNVVIACLPAGQTGTNSAAAVALQMKSTFRAIRFALMVGIGGGVPSPGTDVRLGDVVVGQPGNGHGGVIQYDFGKSTPSGFQQTGFLNTSPRVLLTALSKLRANHDRSKSDLLVHISKLGRLPKFSRDQAGNDVLFDGGYNHVRGSDCTSCDSARKLQREARTVDAPRIHYGTIASGNQVMRDGAIRDQISSELGGVLCFEMEAAGLMNNFPCLVIRGICDYADSHKNKRWQPYAAGTAAACAKELLRLIPAVDVMKIQTAAEATQDSPTRKREPFSTVPFAPDPDFVDRPELLAWIRARCAGPGARAALVGLGGVGKSQLAIQYAHGIREATPHTYVLWVHASTKARVEEAYRSLANRLALPGRHDPKTDVLRLVTNWLCDETNGQWTIIVDNADDVETFFPSRAHGQDEPLEGASASLATYLPQSRNGSILVTSRNKDAAFKLVGNYNYIKEVRVMDESRGLQLLRNKLHGTSAEEGAADLLRALDYTPLAITQAAAYINRRARMTISRYLAEFRANDKKRESLLHRDAGDLRRDASASNSVVTTWQISFERIRQERPSAADLLSLMSFFNPQGIPESILRDSRRVATEPGYEDEADDVFDEDIDVLRAYSLIAETAESDVCEMHALVQFCTRVWLSSSGEAERWKGEFVELMAREFPTGEFENWGRCQQLLPHVESLLDGEAATDELFTDLTRIFKNVAQYTWMKGSYKMAEGLCRRALEGSKKELGEQHPDTLMSVNNLASVLQDQGKYGEAEELHRRALKGREKELGERHPSTLASVNNLASVLQDQGKYGEAEELHRRALEGRKKELGERHPNTLISVYNLAYLLHKQERYEEASELYQRACDGFEQTLGPQHPTTTACLNHFSAMQQEATQARLEQSQKPVHNDRTPVGDVVRPEPRSESASSR